MIDINLPELPARPVHLDLDDTAVRGEDAVPPPGHRVFLGGPLAVPVTARYVEADPELRAFVEREEPHASYRLVHIAVTFESPSHEPPFESGSVEIRLSTSDSSSPPPVAWSMAPERVTDQTHIATGWRLGPELSLGEVSVSLGEVTREREQTHDEVFLEAVRVLRSDPAWYLYRTSSRSLDGAHRLVMVVRGPRDGDILADVDVRASIRQRSLFRYRSRPVPPVALTGRI